MDRIIVSTGIKNLPVINNLTTMFLFLAAGLALIIDAGLQSFS